MATLLSPRSVEYVVLGVALPGKPTVNTGVLLLDPSTDRLHIRLREDWDTFAGEEAPFLAQFDLPRLAEEMGGARLLAYLEDRCSHLLRLTDREATVAADPEARLRRLFRELVAVEGAVPIYSLRAAAGALSEEHEPGEQIGTIDAPPGVRLTAGMFVARVYGQSMEPLIPDGSLCLFRPHGGGSRNGQRLLIEKFGTTDATAQFTVKIYRSEKRVDEDGSWEHTRIRMIPLNPTFAEWELSPEEFRVVGEFVAVLPAEE